MKTKKRINKAKGPVRIDRIAESILDPLVSKVGFSSTQIIAAWPNIVGPELAERSRPERLRWPPRRDETNSETSAPDAGATLFVRAEGGDALEVQYLSGHIIARINAIFGWRAVSRITLRQGPVGREKTVPEPPPSAPEHSKQRNENLPNPKLADVENEELREALARLGGHVDDENEPDQET